MKKIIFLISFFSANLIVCQNMSYTVYEFKVKDQAESGLMELFDSFWKDAKLQENGGFNIEKFQIV